MLTDKNLFNEYLKTKKKLDLVKDELFLQIREICEVCTNINSRERITDIAIEDEDTTYLNEPEVCVEVFSYDYGDDTYYFPKRYLDMTLDEIKADVERIKKLDEEEKQLAETDAEYKQYLRLKEKFEKTKED